MKKIGDWIRKTGLTNLAYLLLSAFSLLIAGSWFFTGGFFGIFLYINFNTIMKLLKRDKQS